MLAAFVYLSMASQVFAHEIRMRNGDRLTGKIVSQNDEVVVIETTYAGKLTIIAEEIEKILDDEAIASAKAAVAVPVPKKPEPKTEPVKAVEAPKPKRLFGEGRFYGIAEGWDGNANVGFSFTTGNTKTTTMTTGIRAVKTGARDNLTVYVRSLWHTNKSLNDRATTQNAFWGGARYERNFSERRFGFISYDFERDKPKNLRFRSVVGSGLGHHLIKNENSEIDVLLGGAWNRTWLNTGRSDTPEGLAAVVLKHKFNPRLKYQNTFTVYQDLMRGIKRRFIMDSTLSADITTRIGWFITIGDRFNNDPQPGLQRNDFLFATGMKWNFGKKK